MKKKTLIIIVIVAILVIFYIIGMVTGNGKPPEKSTEKSDPVETETQVPQEEQTQETKEYKTTATWADLNNYMFAVEVDDFDGDIFQAGSYRLYPDAVDLEDSLKTPIVWDVYVSNNLYTNSNELSESEYVSSVGGIEMDECELELEKGQYVYINYNDVLGEPTGMLQIEMKE